MDFMMVSMLVLMKVLELANESEIFTTSYLVNNMENFWYHHNAPLLEIWISSSRVFRLVLDLGQ